VLGQSQDAIAAVTVTNHGPVGNAPASVAFTTTSTAGLSVSPSTFRVEVPVLLDEHQTVRMEMDLHCLQPGPQTLSLAAAVSGVGNTHIDGVASNNQGTLERIVECWNRAQVNIQPGIPFAVIRRWSAFDVAVIANPAPTAYELRAQWIDRTSLRFGTRVEVMSGRGAQPLYVRIQPAAAPGGSIDSEDDAVGRFLPWQADLRPGFQELCVAGRYTMPSGVTANFVGCDGAVIL
jgi:hypothetical protein